MTCKRCLAEIESRRIEASFDDADWLVDQAEAVRCLAGRRELITVTGGPDVVSSHYETRER